MTPREVFDKRVADIIPMRREQTPEDIGWAAVFLGSDQARNITGQALNVDGLGDALRARAGQERMGRVNSVIGVGVVLATLAAGAPASAQPAADAKAVTEPITKQLEAFRRDDYDTAYTFASAGVRQAFDRQGFEQMVKGGYPEIAHSVSAFVSRTSGGPDGHVFVHVKIQGDNGNSIEALYDMVRESDGWRINGVVTKPDPGVVIDPLSPRARAG